MRRIRIGLVTEGPTDQIVLEKLIGAHLCTRLSDVDVKFIALHPTPDKTSSGYQGGWYLVYKWCLDNKPDLRVGQIFANPLFADDMSAQSCDAVVIQLDTDVFPKFSAHHTIRPEPNVYDPPAARSHFVEQVLNQWLWPDHETPDGRHFPAPIVEAVEAWLIAALTDLTDPEMCVDPGRELATHEAKLKGRQLPTDFRRINKDPERYSRLAKRASVAVNDVYEKCCRFRILVDQLGVYISNLS